MKEEVPPSPLADSATPEGLNTAPKSEQPGSDDQLIFAALNQVGMARGKPSKPISPAFIPSPSDDLSRGDLPDASPDLIPNYQLLREISRGGQGIVYKAIQKTTKRQVAVKVMREGPFAGARDRIRFEREIEILAQLNHPNIVTILDSGVVRRDAGQMHFFAMDYISGRGLDAWLEDSKRSVEDILKVFIKICEAVNAAHLKGIIHRDLKPGNVRVDGDNEPHILDFGLAKTATGEVVDELDAQATPQMMTVTGQLLGSLPWSSPEQADGRISLIDVRTDVYSLGVMLYQCLTGRFPYEVIGAIRDVMNNILHTSPAKPSTVSKPGRAKFNNEVETIVLKCLSKERERRYQNAGELGRDLKNYLDGSPIEAKRDSGWYILRKKATRHRAVAISISAITLAVIAGGASSAVFWQRERVAHNESKAATAVATQAAEREASERRRVQSLFDFTKQVLASPDPDLLQGDNAKGALRIADAGEKRARIDFAAEPIMLADWLDHLGQTHLTFGSRESARRLLAEALDLRTKNNANPLELAASHTHLARALLDTANKAEALSHADTAATILRAQPAETAITDLLSEAECQGGVALRQLGRTKEAITRLQGAIDLRAQAAVTPSNLDAELLTSLGVALLADAQFDASIETNRQAEKLTTELNPGDNSRVFVCRANIARSLLARGGPEDLTTAESILRSTLASNRKLLAGMNPNHPRLSLNLDLLGQVLIQKGQWADATTALRESSGMRTPDLRQNIRPLAVTKCNLARVLRETGDFTAASAILNETDFLLATESGSTLESLRLAREKTELLLAQNKLAEASTLAKQLLLDSAAVAGGSANDRAQAQLLAARIAFANDDMNEAARLARDAASVLSPSSIEHAAALGTLGRAKVALGDQAGGTPLINDALLALDARPGPAKRLAAELRKASSDQK